jgi:hypothetical protein
LVALAPLVDATERVEELGRPVREAPTAEAALLAPIRVPGRLLAPYLRDSAALR